MRILHVGRASARSNNGVHRSIHTLARLANENGHQGLAVRFSRGARKPERDVREGVEQHTLPVSGPPGPAGSFLQVLTPTGRNALKDLLADVDVIHLHSVFQVDHTFVVGRGVPYVVTPHGGYHPRVLARTNARRKSVWGALFDKRILARASAVHALTANEARDVARVQPRATTEVLPIPLDGLPVASPRETTEGPVVFMGRLDIDHKGLDLLLDAWARTCDAWGPGRSLLIAGPADEATARELSDLVSQRGLSETVHLVGPVSGQEKADLLRSASWFVHTSRREGLPLAMVEAAAHGAPLLATDQTNMGNLIHTHGAGLTCGQHVEDIARMFTDAAAMPDYSHRACSRGAVDLAAEFRADSLWPHYERLYGEVSRAAAGRA